MNNYIGHLPPFLEPRSKITRDAHLLWAIRTVLATYIEEKGSTRTYIDIIMIKISHDFIKISEIDRSLIKHISANIMKDKRV